MANGIIPETMAATHYLELSDTDGHLWLAPLAVVTALRAAGISSVTVTIGLTADPPEPQLTVTQAAQRLMQDMRPATDAADAARLFRAAKAMITRACNSGRLVHDGVGHQRRIEVDSLDAWCLARRRKADLD